MCPQGPSATAYTNINFTHFYLLNGTKTYLKEKHYCQTLWASAILSYSSFGGH